MLLSVDSRGPRVLSRPDDVGTVALEDWLKSPARRATDRDGAVTCECRVQMLRPAIPSLLECLLKAW